MGKAVSRNEPCPCGSGKKFKNCCLGKAPPAARRRRAVVPLLLAVAAVALGVWIGTTKGWTSGLAIGGGGLMIAFLAVVIRDPPPPSGGAGDAAGINFGA